MDANFVNESYITKIFTTLSFCLCNVRRWWKCEEIRIFDLSIFKSEFPDPKRSMFYQARDYLSVNKIEWRLHLAVLPPVLDVLMYLKLGEKKVALYASGNETSLPENCEYFCWAVSVRRCEHLNLQSTCLL